MPEAAARPVPHGSIRSRRRSDVQPDLRDPANQFALAVIIAGVGFAAGLVWTGQFGRLPHPAGAYLAFAMLVIASELFVLRLPSRANDVLLSASSVFAYASALLYGPG